MVFFVHTGAWLHEPSREVAALAAPHAPSASMAPTVRLDELGAAQRIQAAPSGEPTASKRDSCARTIGGAIELRPVNQDRESRVSRPWCFGRVNEPYVLPRPLGSRTDRSWRDEHSAALHVDEDHQIEIDASAPRPGPHRQEVACPQRLGVTSDELVPGHGNTPRPSIDAVFVQDVADGRAPNRSEVELLDLGGQSW